ncbi:kinase-like protein, partial [Exidia glandulosa HHB12029]
RIVHGDLKGVNILVCDDGVACIADFGVSAVLAQYPAQNATPAGTFRWMAPELLQDDSRVTWASDMWAYGCVIMEV